MSAEDLEANLAKLGDNASFEDIEALLNGQAGSDGSTAVAPSSANAAAAAAADENTPDVNNAAIRPDESTRQANEPATTPADAKAAAASTENTNVRETVPPAQSDEQVAGVLGPDGKSVIPYGVLKSARQKLGVAENTARTEREGRERAEAEAKSLREQLETRQATQRDVKEVQKAADSAGITDTQGNKVDVLTIDVDKLREEYDGPIVDVIAQLQRAANAAIQKVTQLEAETQRDRDARTQQVRAERATTIQQDIDNVPALSNWQGTDPDKWEAAKVLDDRLAQKPEWAGKPRIDRFREVARKMGAADNELGLTTQTNQTAPATAATGKNVQEQLAAAARVIPASHSDLPAGSAAAQSEIESLNQMGVTQVEEKFSRMRPDQIDALLAKLG